MTVELILSIAFFIYGTLFGSFLTLVGYRVPLKQSIVSPPSHCSNCNHRLKLIDLMPIISFVLNKGKCRYCGDKYGSFHVWMEIFLGIAFYMGFIYCGLSINLLIFLVIIMNLNITVVSLHVHKTVINKLNIVMFGLVFIFSLLSIEIHNIYYLLVLLVLNVILYANKNYKISEFVVVISFIGVCVSLLLL